MSHQSPLWLAFDGVAWPNPDDPRSTEWTLRYGEPTHAQRLFAATVIDSYRQLIDMPDSRRRSVISRLRKARNAHRLPAAHVQAEET